MRRIAIVGVGPVGLCVLARIVASARRRSAAEELVEVHVIEPAQAGMGIYDIAKPDYLVMNSACGDITLVPDDAGDVLPSCSINLHNWAVARGYRWVEGVCRLDPGGRPIEREDFLPRRLMGEYLVWLYEELVAQRPPWLHIERHPLMAVDVTRRADGGEDVHLADGVSLAVDHVVLSFGHVGNVPATASDCAQGWTLLPPYPASAYLDPIPPQATVLVCGMGLVGMDVITTLTEGRGGRYEKRSGRFVYKASGLEPRIDVVSRSGLPYRSKTASMSRVPERDRPIVFTHEAIDALKSRGAATLDFRRDLLPLLFQEMRCRHHLHAVAIADGNGEAARLGAHLRAATGATVVELLSRLDQRFGAFDPAALLFGQNSAHTSSADYQDFVRRSIAEDLDEDPASSPSRAACETFRVLRDSIRSAVEFGALTLESYLDFHHGLRGHINRLVAGPPPWRLRQLLALMEAGVVRMPYGQRPQIAPLGDGRDGVSIASTRLDVPHVGQADAVVRGFLEDPDIEASASTLLERMHRSGRLQPLRYGDVSVGSVDVSPDAHPLDAQGQQQERLWLFGALTEGTRYFTHYLPSPYRGRLAYEEIGQSVETMLA